MGAARTGSGDGGGGSRGGRYLLWKEAAYVTGLDPDWADTALWLLSSHTRTFAYWRPAQAAVQSLLVRAWR